MNKVFSLMAFGGENLSFLGVFSSVEAAIEIAKIDARGHLYKPTFRRKLMEGAVNFIEMKLEARERGNANNEEWDILYTIKECTVDVELPEFRQGVM